MIRNYISLSAIGKLLLFLIPFLPGSFAQYDVRFINQAFTPEENMRGIHHAIINAPEFVARFTNTNVLQLVDAPNQIVPVAVRVVLQRFIFGEPDIDTLDDTMDGIIAAQEGPGEVFADYEIDANDPEVPGTVTFTINFADNYRFIATTPRDRDNIFDPPSDGENEPEDPPSPPGDECLGNFPNDFGINYHRFDFSFNSAF